MKRIMITLAVVFGMITAAQAQFVIGGSLNFNGASNATSINGDWGAQGKTSNFGFAIQPSFGYVINEKVEVGAKLSLDYDHRNRFVEVENADGKTAAKEALDSRTADFSWSINPYARYRLFEVKGFAVWIQGEAELGTSLETKTTYFAYGTESTNIMRTKADAETMNKSVDGRSYSKFNGAFYVKPVMTYDITEHWVLSCDLNLLSLGIWGSAESITVKNVPGTTIPTTDRAGNEKPLTQTTNDFNFNLGLFQGRTLGIGVVYKF